MISSPYTAGYANGKDKKNKSERAKIVARVLLVSCFVLFLVGVLYIINPANERHVQTGSVLDDQGDSSVHQRSSYGSAASHPGNIVLEHLKKLEKKQLEKNSHRMQNLEDSTRDYLMSSKDNAKKIAQLSKQVAEMASRLHLLEGGPAISQSTEKSRTLAAQKPMLGSEQKTAPVRSESFAPRQQEVIEEFKYSWKAYKDIGWGHDEVKPISRTYHEWFGIGLTLVDALDTLWLMGLDDEFEDAKNWVKTKLSFDKNTDVNLFECTIRELGGLLSAYALSNDRIFLDKAEDLGNRLLPAFKTQSGVPYSDVNLKTGKAHAPTWGSDSSLAEVTTIQIEFEYLSQQTKDPKFKDVVEKVNEIIASKSEKTKIKHLLPIFINANSGEPSQSARVSLGARGDSYYEYLLKQWLLTGKKDERMRIRYMGALEAIETHLVLYSKPNNYAFIAEKQNGGQGGTINKMDHLVCFMPGLIALGAANGAHTPNGAGGIDEQRMQLAKNLLETCILMYENQPTGLAPEIVFFNTESAGNKPDMRVKPADAHNLLRPETIESLFILYRLTKDEKYRDRGYTIFQNFKKYCKVGSGGYSSIKSVLTKEVKFRDKMESFWLAETLKYFFLLFSDDFGLVDLNKYVLNTEAHPLPVFS